MIDQLIPYNMDDLKTPSVLNEVKAYLQNIDSTSLGELSTSELREYIHDAIRILLIEHDTFGYTSEELEFYTTLRFKTLTDGKSKSYIKTQVRATVAETSYISTTYLRIFGKDQKRFLVRV